MRFCRRSRYDNRTERNDREDRSQDWSRESHFGVSLFRSAAWIPPGSADAGLVPLNEMVLVLGGRG